MKLSRRGKPGGEKGQKEAKRRGTRQAEVQGTCKQRGGGEKKKIKKALPRKTASVGKKVANKAGARSRVRKKKNHGADFFTGQPVPKRGLRKKVTREGSTEKDCRKWSDEFAHEKKKNERENVRAQ